MAYQAFVSSTFEDLKDHRKAVIAALRKAGFFVDPMEDWTAATDAPKTVSQERLRGCDLCVLLVAFRRGYVPEGETASITELEYRAAVQAGVDVLAFLLAEDSPWPRRFDELDKDPELRRWRAELAQRRGIGSFGLGPDTIEIQPALTRWIAEKQQAALSGVVQRPAAPRWNPKVVRIGIRCGLLQQGGGAIRFTPQVAESLRANGKDWVLGKPLRGSHRVLADWTEYSAMSIVVATSPGTVLAEELQDLLYIECQHQLIGFLLGLALQAGVLQEQPGGLTVAEDLNDEMMENFQHLDSLDYLEEAAGDPHTAAVLAFVDMVRARLLLHAPDESEYAEALATLVLSQFGFWHGPDAREVAAGPGAPARRTRSRRPAAKKTGGGKRSRKRKPPEPSESDAA